MRTSATFFLLLISFYVFGQIPDSIISLPLYKSVKMEYFFVEDLSVSDSLYLVFDPIEDLIEIYEQKPLICLNNKAANDWPKEALENILYINPAIRKSSNPFNCAQVEISEINHKGEILKSLNSSPSGILKKSKIKCQENISKGFKDLAHQLCKLSKNNVYEVFVKNVYRTPTNVLPALHCGMSLDSIYNYLSSEALHPIEGVYRWNYADAKEKGCKVAIIKSDKAYCIIYLQQCNPYWFEGSIQAMIPLNVEDTPILVDWFSKNRSHQKIELFFTDSGGFELHEIDGTAYHLVRKFVPE